MTGAPSSSRPVRVLIFLLSPLLLLGAEASPAARRDAPTAATITFQISYHGQPAPEEGLVLLECRGDQARLRTVPPGEPLAGAPREWGHADFKGRRTLQLAEVREGRRIGVAADFAGLPDLEETEERAEILGFPCRKATTVLRSNRLEIWYTRDTPLRGGPYLSLLVPDGLVLRVVRNGEHEITATELRPGASTEDLWPRDEGEALDLATYRARVAAGWVTTLSVFQGERINFEPAALDTAAMAAALRAGQGADSTAVLRFAAGTLILRRLTLPRLDDALLFAELTTRSRGDAYDRTGSLFLIPTDRPRSFLDALAEGVDVLPAFTGRDGRRYQGITATADYTPPLELVRFITPFGVGHFNDQVRVEGVAWADSAVYKMDLGGLAPLLRGPVWIGAFIGNYDAGGHELSLRLSWHPGSRVAEADRPDRSWILPLFNTVNVLEMAGQEYGRLFGQDTLSVEFDLPEGVRDLRLRYLGTGHGGWGGGDEFNPKLNTILVDGRPVAALIPWRSDCATYRSLNPASGNFWNGVSSSDLSRSGWCPGAAAEPVTIPLPGLAPGRHRLQVAIPQGAPEGGGFSAWNVSGVLLAERE
ncbi:MAG: PNGase F N-terminal domain-containing protein [bacterium]|nr:PNGase F N-terminal domain-containing protein [bacterium]